MLARDVVVPAGCQRLMGPGRVECCSPQSPRNRVADPIYTGRRCVAVVDVTGDEGVDKGLVRHDRATGRYLPCGITQCHLLPDTGERAPP